jgi:hypothetical protein
MASGITHRAGLTHDHGGQAGASWTPTTALQLAWTTWLVLLALPFVILPLSLHLLPGSRGSEPKPELAEQWYAVVMVYIAGAVPIALVVRAFMFKAFWRGGVVPAQRYYAGMLLVWSVVLAAGLTAELVCIATATLVPNVLPGMLALFIFLLLWPTGRVMEERRQNS